MSSKSHLTRRNFLMAAGVLSIANLAGANTSRAGNRGKNVTLLHFTDTHAQLESHLEYLPANPRLQSLGGFARLKSALQKERASSPEACFIIDGGDEFQGSGPAAWSQGEVMVEPLNDLGLDVFVPGNWEPAYGPIRFLDQMSRLKAAKVCYNLHDAAGRRIFPAAVTLERGQVKVAFVGVTDVPASKRQPPSMFAGLDTTRIQGLRQFIRDVRQSERPDLVVVVTHTGLTISRQMAREIPEIDVVLSGHSHERTNKPIREGNAWVIETGSMGSFLGRLDLTLNALGQVADCSFRLVPIDSSYPEDPRMKALVAGMLAPYRERMNRIVGQTRTPILRYDVLETTADNFISDAVRQAAGTDIGLTNGFRFGVPIDAGPVRESDLWNLLPMDTRIKAGWVTGSELRAYLEDELELVFSRDPWKLSGGWGPRLAGVSMTYRAGAPVGNRLLSIKVNGQPLQDSRKYGIAGCEREGEPLDVVCRHAGTHDVNIVEASIHRYLLQYCKSNPVLEPTREGRAVAVDLPHQVFSQDEILSL